MHGIVESDLGGCVVHEVEVDLAAGLEGLIPAPTRPSELASALGSACLSTRCISSEAPFRLSPSDEPAFNIERPSGVRNGHADHGRHG
jgi:hypothetical protein